MDDLNGDIELNRRTAAYTVKLYSETLALLTAEIAGLKRWILTSLLAINGAAAVATWQVQMQPSVKVTACILFTIGLVLPLISAETSTNRAPALMAKIGEHLGYWLTVEHDGIRVAELERLDVLNRMTDDHRKLPTRLAWLSLSLFVAGLAVSGLGAFPAAKASHNASSVSSKPAPLSSPVSTAP